MKRRTTIQYLSALICLIFLALSAVSCGGTSGPTVSAPATTRSTGPETGTASDPATAPAEEDPYHPFKFDISAHIETPDVTAWTLDRAKLEQSAQQGFEDFLTEGKTLTEKGADDVVESGDETEIYYKGILIVYDGDYTFTMGESGIPALDEALKTAVPAEGVVRLEIALPVDFTLPEVMKRENGLLDAELSEKTVTVELSGLGDALPEAGRTVEAKMRFLYAFPGGTFDENSAGGDGYPLTIGSGQFIPGFEEGMIGMSAAAGAKRTVRVTFPDPYRNNPALAGEPTDFEVTVVSVKTTYVYDLDNADDFARFKEAYEAKNGAGSFTYANKEAIMDQCRGAAKEQMIVELVDEKAKITTMPEEQLSAYMEIMRGQFVMQYSSYYYSMIGRALTEAEIVNYFFGGDRTGFDTQVGTYARKILARHLTLFLIAQQNGLAEVTEEDVQTQLEGIAAEYGGSGAGVTGEQVLEALFSGKRSEVVKQIVSDRTVKFLTEIVPAV